MKNPNPSCKTNTTEWKSSPGTTTWLLSYWFSSNPTILFQQNLVSKGENKIISFLQKEKSKLDISGRQKNSREAVSMNYYLKTKRLLLVSSQLCSSVETALNCQQCSLSPLPQAAEPDVWLLQRQVPELLLVAWAAQDLQLCSAQGRDRSSWEPTFCFLLVPDSPLRMLGSMASMSFTSSPNSLSLKLNTSCGKGKQFSLKKS